MKVWKINNKYTFYNNILKINETELDMILTSTMKKNYYQSPIELPKKGGKRIVYSVNSEHRLYKIQKNVTKNFLDNILLPDTVYGFRKEKNYIDYLIPHIDFYGNNNYIRLDIENFFSSINTKTIRKTISSYFEVSANMNSKDVTKAIDNLIQILTYNGKVVQGAPCSPSLSNIIFRRLDIRIERYCRVFEVTYTRYADDMLFSSRSKMLYQPSFISGISKIISDEKFVLNYSKIIRAEKVISLGGYVISDDIRLSRSKLSNISRVLFYIEKHKDYKSASYYDDLNSLLSKEMKDPIQFNGIYSLINYLSGNRAFIISVVKYSKDEKFRKKAVKIITRIEQRVLELNKCIG